MSARLRSAILAVALVAALPVRALAGNPAPTGLDPTQALSAAIVRASTTTVDASTTASSRTLEVRAAVTPRDDVDLILPYDDALRVGTFGSVSGQGDLGLRYTRIFGTSKLREAAGLRLTFPTGASTFSSGADTIAPFAAVAYSPLPWITAVAVPSYGVDARPRFGYPDTQKAALDIRLIARLPYGFYAAPELRDARVSGTYRYGERLARFTVGAVIAHHFNIAAYVQTPAFSPFTYTNVERGAAGISLSIQR